MELKNGFKQCEIGAIPKDWDVTPLDQVARTVDSLHITPNFSEVGYPMVRVTDIKPGNLKLESALKVSKVVFDEFIRNYKPKRNDIVLARVGSYGVSSFVDTDDSFCMGQNTVVIEAKVPPRFLYYVLNSSYTRKQIEDGSYGSGYKSLSLKNIKELLVPIPNTIKEQSAIAEALTDLDKLLSEIEKLIAKKRDIKQATMQQLLTGKTRLPGFNKGKGPIATEYGMIPSDWTLTAISKAFELLTTASYSRSQLYESGEGYCVHYGDIHTSWDFYLDFNVHQVPQVKNDQLKYPQLKNGDLIMADASEDYSGVGKSVEVKNLGSRKAISGLHTFLMRDKGYFADGFRGYIHSIPIVKRQYDKLATGLKVYGLSKNNLRTVAIPTPSINEQVAIVDIFQSMESEIQTNVSKLEKLKLLKRGMMQELLTGRIRLI